MFRNSLFNKINQSRNYTTNNQFRDLAFNQNVLDIQTVNNLDSKITILQQSITQAEKKLNRKKLELYNYQQDKNQLTEPFHRSEQARNKIDEMVTIITEGIYQSLLNGKSAMKHGPTFGYNVNVLKFFESLFAQYGMSYEISTTNEQGGTSTYLHIQFSEKFNNAAPALHEDNAKFNEWLISFDDKVKSAYINAQNKISDDFMALKKELYDPIINGNSLTLSNSQPCAAAFTRFEKMASHENISVSRHGNIITADKKNAENVARMKM